MVRVNDGYVYSIILGSIKYTHRVDADNPAFTLCGEPTIHLGKFYNSYQDCEYCPECDIIPEQMWPEEQWEYNSIGLAKNIEER